MRHVETIIVGAGFAGIAAGLRLLREGRGSFVILERSPEIGGVWRDNRYPGVTCDVPSHLYCLAEHPNPDWSALFAPGAEIHDYLRRLVREQGISSRIRTSTPMIDARHDGRRWVVETGGAGAGQLTADTLVLACGRLSEPAIPEIAGLETFPGALFHSARWDATTPIAGRRIGVVGTGASAIQIVPELVRRGAEVVLFQRTPAWILPRGGHAYPAEERAGYARDPESLTELRDELYREGEQRFAARSGDAAASAAARDAALAHLAAQVPDVKLRARLTPEYAFGCKRVLLSDDFYPALASGQVTLVDAALAAVDGRELIAADDRRESVDALVLATGFEASVQPYAHLVRGADGSTLHEHWASGMTAFASTLVAGFPDLYVLNGPNASLGHNSAVLMIEQQLDLVARCLSARDSAEGAASIRVEAAAEREYTREIDARADPTPWLRGGCRNWYVDPRSGRLTLLWPGTVDEFRTRLEQVDPTALVHATQEGPV